jgi:hypothetical protein
MSVGNPAQKTAQALKFEPYHICFYLAFICLLHGLACRGLLWGNTKCEEDDRPWDDYMKIQIKYHC